MKKFIEINVNGNSLTVAAINYIMNAECDAEGRVIFTKPDDLIAKCKGYPKKVEIYAYTDPSGTKDLRIISISPQSIKAIYNQIIEIEELESEEFCD
jgi:hypothetical protein